MGSDIGGLGARILDNADNADGAYNMNSSSDADDTDADDSGGGVEDADAGREIDTGAASIDTY
jgi:hypothetical protein